MRKLVAWLSKDEPFNKFINSYLTILAGVLVIVTIAAWVAGLIFPPEMVDHVKSELSKDEQYFGTGTTVILVDVIAPIAEEFFWRLICIGVPMLLYWKLSKRLMNPYIVIALVLVVSGVFGYSHGTLANILIQGTAGICIAILFLKVSAYGRRVFRGYCASVMVHSGMNFVFTLPIFFGFIAGLWKAT